MLGGAFFTIYVLFEVAALLCIRAAIARVRTPQGAAAWSVFLLAAPHFAVPAFLIFGHRRYPGYIAARRALREEAAQLRQLAFANAAATDPEDRGRIHAFERMAGVPFSSGNALGLMIDGERSFTEMFAAIDRAEHYVLAEFYTVASDALGQLFAERLEAKARAGVPVYLLYDAIGSRLPRSYLRRLRDAGVRVRDFHAIRRSRGRLQVNFRNHRKILVIDGNLAFTGGANVADSYVGRDPVPRLRPWRDTMLRVEGPCVAQLQFLVAEDWLWSSQERLELNWTPSEPEGVPREEGMSALVLAPGPADAQETGSLYFVNAIAAARQRIWIASPYFVPDVDILSALKVAALRGVEVRLLMADTRDHWLVWLAAFAYIDEIRAAGVEVWRYMEGFHHQKVLLVDDDIASVGTVNLDNRSCRLNFEDTVIAQDRRFAAEVARMLAFDFEHASRNAPSLSHHRSWRIRTLAPMARLLAPIL